MRTIAFIASLLLAFSGFAASIPGTVVSAKITTGNTVNTNFSIGDTSEMAGTSKQAADISARDAIPAARRTEGMSCWVVSETKLYRLIGGIDNTNWTDVSSASSVTEAITNQWKTDATNAATGLVAGMAPLAGTNVFTGTNTFANTVYVSNKLGVGISAPLYPLHVSKNADDLLQCLIDNPNTGSSAMSVLAIDVASSGGLALGSYGPANSTFPGVGRLHTWGGLTNLNLSTLAASSMMSFYLGGSTVAYEKMRIESSGRVGIGKTNPASLFDVNGGISASNVTASAAPGFGGDGSGLSNIPISGIVASGQIVTNGNETAVTFNSSTFLTGGSSNEVASQGWVRRLMESGVTTYNSTNLAPGLVYGAQPYQAQATVPAQFSRTYSGVTNNQYVGSVLVASNVLQLGGPVTVSTYLSYNSGGGRTLSFKPEIYYSYDNGTNLLGDWDCQAQTIVGGTTNRYDFVISFPTTIATNTTGFSVYRVGKVTAQTSNPNLTICGGTNTPSQISYRTPAVVGGIYSGSFVGNGSGLTNLHGTNIQAGTIKSNAIDSGTWQLATNATDYSVRSNLPSSSELMSEPDSVPLTIPTYDGDLNVTHPSLVDMGKGNTFGGHRYWLGFTPYPDQSRENPSVAYSDDLVNWYTNGISNPIFTAADAQNRKATNNWNPPGNTAYWSDTHLFYNSQSNKLYLVGRLGLNGSTNYPHLLYKTSTNGLDWSGYTDFYGNDTTQTNSVSPSIVDIGTGLRVYVVSTYLRYFETDYNLANPSVLVDCGSFQFWHGDVKRLADGTYWALGIQGYGETNARPLIWATSPDGAAWTTQSTNALPASGTWWDSNLYYKPTVSVKSISPPVVDLIIAARQADLGHRALFYRDLALPSSRIISNSLGPVSVSPVTVNAENVLADSLVARSVTYKVATSTVATASVALDMSHTNAEFSIIKVTTNSSFFVTNASYAYDTLQQHRFLLDGQTNSNVWMTFPSDWAWITPFGASARPESPFDATQSNVLLTLMVNNSTVYARAESVTVPPESIDPSAAAFFAATGELTADETNAINHFVKGLKSHGVPSYWSRLQVLYPFVGGTDTKTKVNLKIPGTYDITYAGTMYHTNGLTGGGTTSTDYGDTGYTFAGVETNNIHYFVWVAVEESSAGTLYAIGCADANSRVNLAFTSATALSLSLVDGTASGFTDTGEGAWIVTRDNSTQRRMSHNGADLYSWDVNSTGPLPAYSLGILSYHNNTSAFVGNSHATLWGVAVGTAIISNAEVDEYYGLWNDFQTELGRQ